MVFIRIISLLLACFLAFMAYEAQDPSLVLGSLFFFVMAYLSIRSSGTVDSPYVFLALSTVCFFYSFSGLLSGQFTWRRHTIIVQLDPQLFWFVFSGTSLLGIGLLAYVYNDGVRPYI